MAYDQKSCAGRRLWAWPTLRSLQGKGFSFFFTNTPLTVEGNHSVVMLFDPFFKHGSDSKFDPSKDLSSFAAASPCSSLSCAASMQSALLLNFKADSSTVPSWLDSGHDFRCEPMF